MIDGSILEYIDTDSLLSDNEMTELDDLVGALMDFLKGKIETCVESVFPDAYMISTNYSPDGRLEIYVAGGESPVSEIQLNTLRQRMGVDVSEFIPTEIIDGCILVASPCIKSDADEEC